MTSIQQASVIVGRSLGFATDFDGSTGAINALPTDAKLSLTAGLGAYIRANPSEFTAGQVATANSMPAGFPQVDASFSVSDFFAEAGHNANQLVVQPLVNVGQSVSAVATALPLILIVVGAVLLIAFTKGKAAQLNP